MFFCDRRYQDLQCHQVFSKIKPRNKHIKVMLKACSLTGFSESFSFKLSSKNYKCLWNFWNIEFIQNVSTIAALDIMQQSIESSSEEVSLRFSDSNSFWVMFAQMVFFAYIRLNYSKCQLTEDLNSVINYIIELFFRISYFRSCLV